MSTGLWFRLLLIGSLVAGGLVGAAGAANLGMDWKERAPEEGPYLGVMIVPDASLVYAGGNMIYVRSWDREIHWGNRPARVSRLQLRRETYGHGTGEQALGPRQQGY